MLSDAVAKWEAPRGGTRVVKPVGAQEPTSARPVHARITGVSTSEVSGVVKLEGSRVSGNPVRITGRFVQFRRPGDSRLLTVPRPGQQLAGYWRAIGDGLIELIPFGEKEALSVPLDAIGKWEPPQGGTPVGKEARVQDMAQSFEELRGILKAGQLVIVISKTGDKTWGQVCSICHGTGSRARRKGARRHREMDDRREADVA